MDSGELSSMETMETLTELGDELTLGDIDGEGRGRGWLGVVVVMMTMREPGGRVEATARAASGHFGR